MISFAKKLELYQLVQSRCACRSSPKFAQPQHNRVPTPAKAICVMYSVIHCLLKGDALSGSTFRTHHPLGVMPVDVIVEGGQGNKETPVFRTLSFIRTARWIMTGSVHIPDELVRELKTDLPDATESIVQMSTAPTAQLDAENITEAFCEFVLILHSTHACQDLFRNYRTSSIILALPLAPRKEENPVTHSCRPIR